MGENVKGGPAAQVIAQLTSWSAEGARMIH